MWATDRFIIRNRTVNKYENRTSALRLCRRLLHQARPYWRHIVGIGLLSAVSVPISLVMPLPIKIVVDSVLGSKPLPGPLAVLLPAVDENSRSLMLIVAVVLVLLIALATQLQAMGSSLLSVYTSQKVTLGFRERLFPHVQRLSPAFHDARGTADSIYRVLYDTAAVPSVLIDGIVPFATAGLTIAGMLVVTLFLNWRLAMIALVIAPVILMITLPFSRRLRREWEIGTGLASSIQASLQEVLGAVRVVVAFGKEESEKRKLMELANQGVKTHMRIAFTKCLLDLGVGLVASAGVACIIFVGVRQIQAGALTLGEFLIVMTYLTQLYGPVQTIVAKVGDVQASLVSVERALNLLDEVPAVQERPHARPIKRARGEIEFKSVSFGYDRDHLVLDSLSFSIEAGTRLGIVGATGAGKTTLVNLLTRFYDPTLGQVLLDGADLCDYRLADLRGQFAMVLQDSVLFSGTIGENIAYGRPNASESEIHQAAALAGVEKFIQQLPEGYRTRVGERGMRMSGGERQRISLARAFLKNAPILILDEPTSSVDMRTEREILDAMKRLMKGRTSLVIAHRSTTLQHCDRILLIKNGRLEKLVPSTSLAATESMMFGNE